MASVEETNWRVPSQQRWRDNWTRSELLVKNSGLYRYFVLVLLAVVTGMMAYFGRGVWFFDAFAANITAGFVAALFIVFFVDRAAEQRRELERRRIELVAMKQIRLQLVHLTELFADMIKAALPSHPTTLPATYGELFSAPLTDTIDWLRMDGPSGVLGADWYSRTHNDLSRIANEFLAIVDRYLPFLNVSFLELVDDVLQCHFPNLLKQLKPARDNIARQGQLQDFSLNKTKEARDEFFVKLLRLIAYYEVTAGEPLPVPANFGRNDVSPKFGDARLAALPAGIQVRQGLPAN
jgi:hypothetical protein